MSKSETEVGSIPSCLFTITMSMYGGQWIQAISDSITKFLKNFVEQMFAKCA